jgi:tetratricopeptide (TPR) repeat protein
MRNIFVPFPGQLAYQLNYRKKMRMKPYSRLRQAGFRYCLLLSVLVVNLPSPAQQPAAVKPELAEVLHGGSDPHTRSGAEHFYNMEYDQAIHDYQLALQQYPDDPFALNHLLTAVLFKELERIGALDSELYSGNSFLSARQLAPDPKVRQRINELTSQAMALAEGRLKDNPNDVNALYALGVTKGTRATTLGLMDKAWFSALRSALAARRDHERVLELDPAYIDAKLIIGIHNYIIGSLPWTAKVAASMVGLSGSRQKGIEYLYGAANNGLDSAADAKVILSLFLRREQRYSEAIEIVTHLTESYPRSYLFALEYANLLNAAGRGPEAIASYRRLLELGKTGAFHQAHLEEAAWGLGESLRGQRDFFGAALAYESVPGFPQVDPELKDRGNLAAGEMYDLLQKRDLALKKYEQVVAATSDSARANLARRYMKQPYRGENTKL